MTGVESAVFWVAAVAAVIGGIGVITSRSAIYSALSLILTLAQLAVLYVLLNAQFIAAVQILIYAGAIMVLFLFVITLLGVHDSPFGGEHLPLQRFLSLLFAAVLLLGVVFFVAQSPNAMTGAHGICGDNACGGRNFNTALTHGNVRAFGTQLFTTFVFPFEATPLLLIVAMMGAVALGRRHGPQRPAPVPAGSKGEDVPARPSEPEPETADV